MPIKLSQLKSKTRHLRIDLGDGDELNITYRPHEVSLSDNQDIVDAGKEGTANILLAERMARALIDWDLVDDEGVPLPIDAETMMLVSEELASLINSAIQEDHIPNSRKGRR